MTIIRPAVPSDQAALYRICLLTADAGADASPAGRDASLFGHLYAGPYLALQPDFAWVLEDADGPCGYVLATPDSADFYARMERDWLPPLRAQYAAQAGDPRDAALLAQLNRPWALAPALHDWPAHLHIDLLPRAQGQGLGAKLLQTALTALTNAGVTAVHLGVDPRNQRALDWYGRFGFHPLFRQPGCIWLGRRA